ILSNNGCSPKVREARMTHLQHTTVPSLNFLTRAALVATALLAASPLARAESFTFTPIAVPGAASTELYGINDAGQMVGQYGDGMGTQHGFLYNSGSFTQIDVPGASKTLVSGINNAGQIVGSYYLEVEASARWHGFIYSDGSFTTLDRFASGNTFLFGINNAGQIVGGAARAFVYAGGGFTDLFSKPGDCLVARGINDAGQIVGSYEDDSQC